VQVGRLGHPVMEVHEEGGYGHEGEGGDHRPGQHDSPGDEEVHADFDAQAGQRRSDEDEGEDVESFALGTVDERHDAQSDELDEDGKGDGEPPCPGYVAREDAERQKVEGRRYAREEDPHLGRAAHDEDGGGHDPDEDEGGDGVEGPAQGAGDEEVDAQERAYGYHEGDGEDFPENLPAFLGREALGAGV